MTNLPPAQTGLVRGFIPRKRYPMASTRQTIIADLLAGGMERRTARTIGTAFGKIFEKQATDEYLNYRAIEESLGGGKEYATIVVGASDSLASASEVDFHCTGSADEATINEAIDALTSSGGKVLLLEGTYNLSGSISADSGTSRLHLQGMGPGTVLNAEGLTDPAIDFASGESGASAQWISDLWIHLGDYGIDIASDTGLVRNVTFDGQLVSALQNNGSFSSAIFVNNVFLNCPVTIGSGGGSHCIFAHNQVTNADLDVAFQAQDWYIAGNQITNGDLNLAGNDCFVTVNNILNGSVVDTGSGNVVFANRTISGIVIGDDTFVFIQAAPATTWDIVHNLANFPAVTVVDGTLTVVMADVQYLDNNEIEISFTNAQSGTAYLNV